MPTNSFHDVTTRYGGRQVLTVADVDPPFKQLAFACVFDVQLRKQVCEFPVRHEGPGFGTRIAISRDDAMCFVGCYAGYGVAAYAIPSGKEIWRRKDLKSVQRVAALNTGDLVFCGRENGAAHLLNAGTGETVKKLSGIKDMYISPFDASVIVDGRSLELQRPLGTRKTTIKRRTKHVRTCAFSASEIIISEPGSVRCFDLNSHDLLWEHVPADDVNYTRFLALRDQKCFVALRRNQDNSKTWIDYLQARKWGVVQEVQLAISTHGEFCLDGTALFCGHLRVLSTYDGQVLHDFTTSEILNRDPQYRNALLQSLAGNAMSKEEVAAYMQSEGFTEQEIKKVTFLKPFEGGRGGKIGH